MSTPRQQYWVIGSVALAAAFLLGGYEFIRSGSNTLFKAAYGVQNLPVIMAVMPIGVLGMLYGYGWILSRLGPRRTLLATTLGSGVVIAGCYAAIGAGFQPATGVLYIFREAYVILLIEQYWSYLNSTLGEAAAKKFNGPICGIASLGAIAGGLLVHQWAVPFGTLAMIACAAVSLAPTALCSDLAFRRGGEPQPSRVEAGGQRGHLGLQEFIGTRLPILMAIIILTQIVSTVLGLHFQGLLQATIPDPDPQTAYSGRFYALLNGVAAFLQFIAAPVLLRWVSLRVLHVAIPLLHVLAAVVAATHPSLAAAGLAYLLFKACDYSLFRAAKELLYIPLSFDARYRAKELIDVFGYRVSKGGTSLAITVAQHFGAVLGTSYSLISLGAATLWAVLAVPLMRTPRPSPAASPSTRRRISPPPDLRR